MRTFNSGINVGGTLTSNGEAVSLPTLLDCTQDARSQYVRCISEKAVPWWTDVVITANSKHQALWYEQEVNSRRREGKVPPHVNWLVVPDHEEKRMGSGGATLNTLRVLAQRFSGLDWSKRRVLMIHAGGNSRRLPEYSSCGKLFSILPVLTPLGETSTVLDELLAFSTVWVGSLDSGLVVSSGDVILSFDASSVVWNRPGVTGVALLQPCEIASEHGVYVVDQLGRVYAFLQKPSAAQIQASGGIYPGECAAVDSGLLHIDSRIAHALTDIASRFKVDTEIDLYGHFTMALTGQWAPSHDAPMVLQEIARCLRGVPFWCSVVNGNFTHVGTTRLFHHIFEESCDFTKLYKANQLLGRTASSDTHRAGIIVDSIFTAGADLAPGAMAIECFTDLPVRVGRGAILHGISDIQSEVVIPENTVVHQLFVRLNNCDQAVVVRVYGTGDNPKRNEWLHHPILEVLRGLGVDPECVWPHLHESDRTLWNAKLFVAGTIEEAWGCARWIMGLNPFYSVERWMAATRLSLAESGKLVDLQAEGEMKLRRRTAQWRITAQGLASSGADIRPLLANAPGVAALISAGNALCLDAKRTGEAKPAEAASRFQIASLLFRQAGLLDQSEDAKASAFQQVQAAVGRDSPAAEFLTSRHKWQHDRVEVTAPARVDFGGGWSDTPPFCLDWGGTVLNAAVEMNGNYPIKAIAKRIDEPVIRCISDAVTKEFRTSADLNANTLPGSSVMICQTCARYITICNSDETLSAALTRRGGGLEIRTEVGLPIGSGMGTSSILAAAILRAFSEMLGIAVSDQQLSELVMQVEQKMTTGGGWQDQIGGIYPGVKLAVSTPGMHQRVRVEPVSCAPGLSDRMLLYYTGIERLAKDLLQQVVGRYLARETAAIQVLHHIKSLAFEMSYAMREGDWDYFGMLLDRHWELNQVLDPWTSNSLINGLLRDLRPHLAGAKLAGAGGGGFLVLISKSASDTLVLRRKLARHGGKLYEWEIATTGLRVCTAPAVSDEQTKASRGHDV
jgi:fucokinase